MWFLDLMGCSNHRRRQASKSFPSLLGAEEPATTAVVEPVVIRAKSSRLPQWRPALAVISEDGAATASPDDTVGRQASSVLTRRGSVKTSSRIRPQAAAERNSWHHNNQTARPSLTPAGLFIF